MPLSHRSFENEPVWGFIFETSGRLQWLVAPRGGWGVVMAACSARELGVVMFMMAESWMILLDMGG